MPPLGRINKEKVHGSLFVRLKLIVLVSFQVFKHYAKFFFKFIFSPLLPFYSLGREIVFRPEKIELF